MRFAAARFRLLASPFLAPNGGTCRYARGRGTLASGEKPLPFGVLGYFARDVFDGLINDLRAFWGIGWSFLGLL